MMTGISERAAQYLREELLKRESYTVLVLAGDRTILSVQESNPDWHLAGLEQGLTLPESLSPLLDVSEGAPEPLVFPYVRISGMVIDVHVLQGEGPVELVLHDVTEAHLKEQTLQQRAHEISLLSERRAVLNKELEELNRELLLRRQQAEKASAAKSRFIASMSHEFRSPIASIMGYADLLRTELPDSRNPRALQQASWHLLTLVENLLEQAREGDENVSLNLSRFSLDRVVDDIDALFRTQADGKNLEFIVESSPHGVEIELDELRLRQILINLISNALRYTFAGQVSFHAEHRGNTLHLYVRDTGRGIAPVDLKRIFEPFTRVGEDNSSGAGLGLTITRQLVDRMDGKLEIESKPEVGSEFHVYIPCPRIHDTDSEALPLSGEVLWVDDDQYILSLYQVLLEDWGLTVHTASSVAQGKELMKQHVCPVVVSDLHLTDGDGFELLKEIWAEWPQTEGIIISGSEINDLSHGSTEKQARAFLQKPIDLKVLRSELVMAFAGVDST